MAQVQYLRDGTGRAIVTGSYGTVWLHFSSITSGAYARGMQHGARRVSLEEYGAYAAMRALAERWVDTNN